MPLSTPHCKVVQCWPNGSKANCTICYNVVVMSEVLQELQVEGQIIDPVQ